MGAFEAGSSRAKSWPGTDPRGSVAPDPPAENLLNYRSNHDPNEQHDLP